MPEAHQGHIAMQGRPNIPAATRYPLQFISPGPGGHQATNIMNTQSAGGQQHHVQQPAGQYIRAGPAVVAPQQQQQQQQQQYPAQTAPYVARPNTSVKICDISKEQPLTAEKARERLSQYFVFRFTRADEDSGYASDGSRRKPSWKRAWRIEDRGISKREAARMVRELNRTKIPVMQKKGDLSEEERRQIEMALEDLQKQYDNEYFQTTLAQLDDRIEVKPKEQGKVREREREKNRRKEKHRRVVSKQVKQPASKSKDIKQAVTERVSLTAYFKRAPRPDVDAIAMLRHHEAQREARIRQYAQAMARPQEAQYPAPAAPPPPPQPSRQSTPHPPPRPLPPQQNMHGERPGNARGPGPSGHHAQAGHSQNRGPPVTIIQRKPQEHGNTTGRPQPFQPRPSPHVHQRTRAPPSSTDESVYSDGFSDDEDEDTVCTSPSTTSSYISQGSYEHLRTAHTPKPMFREGPAHYGIPPNFPGDGRRQPQGTVHIQPHRSNERRPSLHDQRPPAFSPNHKPVVHQAALAPIPRPGLFPSRPATMTPAQIPIAPSPPPVQVHPAAVTGGVRGPAPITQAAPAPGHHHHHQHIPPPPAHHHQVHHHISPQAPGSQIPVATAVTHTTAAATATVPGGSLDPKQLYDNAYAAGRADSREEAIRMAERIAAAATGSAAQPEPRGSLTKKQEQEQEHKFGEVEGKGKGKGEDENSEPESEQEQE
ncbi:uncharacterized protein B0T15DRAFT_496844 [Chaetomium strumarium]|uniref:Uncharacterized protein n=1 Tax=Chaetomium strumarium TaxID=1170767 RepID=A0AAJ0LYI7_9PEZI|nr:hypothetical protein B0T15DRAFT_496844 [Chaetomium strumarium]